MLCPEQQPLDNLFAKMYEDRSRETITERNFTMLSAKYQEEQTQIENKKGELKAAAMLCFLF